MNLIPVVIDKEIEGERSYDIFSRLLKDRIIFISGTIDESLANSVVAELLYLDSLNHNDISIYINSRGGEVTSGMAIYDTMNYVKSDIKTICIGMAASMGAFLLLSGTKNKRYSLKNSEIMIHQPLGGVNGKASDIQIATEQILKIKKKLNKIIAEKTNQNLKKVEKDTESDYYLTPEEALKYGIIDEIL